MNVRHCIQFYFTYA